MADPDLPLPIANADPKPWFGSSTIWMSLVNVGLGVAAVAVASLVPMPGDLALAIGTYGTTQVTAGLAAIRGRTKAEQPIAATPGGLLAKMLGL